MCYCVPSLTISVQLVQTDVFYDLAQNSFLLLMKQSLKSEVGSRVPKQER